MTAERLLALARAELGTVEYPPSSNKVKYNTEYYGREVSGSSYSWCCVFLWWLFRQAGSAELFFNGEKTAYCPALLTYHRYAGQDIAGGYQPGDIIFFNFDGKTNAAHVGLCEAWDGTYIATIDGNTGTGNEANGGAVMRRRRHRMYIVGAFRPSYEEEINVTREELRAIVREELAAMETQRAALASSDWAKSRLEEAKAAGLTDGARPQSYATRQEVALMVNAAVKK